MDIHKLNLPEDSKKFLLCLKNLEGMNVDIGEIISEDILKAFELLFESLGKTIAPMDIKRAFKKSNLRVGIYDSVEFDYNMGRIEIFLDELSYSRADVKYIGNNAVKLITKDQLVKEVIPVLQEKLKNKMETFKMFACML